LPDTQEKFFRIGGQVLDAENKAVAGATVFLVERGLTTTTDADGRYSLSPILKGTYTLRVQKGEAVKEVSITVPAPKDRNYNLQLA
jgi:protocatechuate 3,4-dioxygenase beta subunit